MAQRVARSFQQWWAKAAPNGWQQENDENPPPGLELASWQATRQWTRWLPQPQLGWTVADVPPPPPPEPTPGDAVAILVHAYFERWSGRLAALPQGQATDAPPPPPPSFVGEPTWQPTRPWAQWKPQPQVGWQQETDVAPTPTALPELAWRPTRQFPRWSPQPWQGWQQEGGEPSAAPAPSWAPSRQWKSWTRQPQLGWAQATDVTRDAPILLPLRPYLFRGFRRQADLGWASAHDVRVVEVGPAVPQLLHAYLFHGFPPQAQHGWNSGESGAPSPPALAPFTITVRRLRLLHQEQQR